jgi:spermidine synthase
MLPWVELGTATVPGDGARLRLMQRGSEFCIFAGTTPLMNSRLSGSEEDLATLAWACIGSRRNARVLIGGLGMGFTLRAALAVMPADARLTVVELVPEIVVWARGPLAPLFDSCLDDPRVGIEVADVAAVIGRGKTAYDAILLDVDNGPEGLSRDGNDGLYTLAGLARARAALTPGGVLAVWSAHPDDRFTRRLAEAGFAAEAVRVRARHGGRGARHTIWLASRPQAVTRSGVTPTARARRPSRNSAG